MKHDKVPLALISLMFFTIGVMFCMNDILLPIVRDVFQLTYLEATFIQMSFYVVYLLWPLLISKSIGIFGYRKNILAAMAICIVGCLLFVPSYWLQSYLLILLGVFTISTGVTIVNVAANPYAALLGTPDGAHVRLNFVQAFSRVGYAATPLVASALIYTAAQSTPRIHVPYLVLAGLILIVMIVMAVVHMPDFKPSEMPKMSLKNLLAGSRRHPRLYYGIPAMFFYVGAEACTSGFFISYMITHGYTQQTAASYLTLYYVFAALFALLGAALLKVVRPGALLATFGCGMLLCYVMVIGGPDDIAPYALVGMGGFISVMFPTVFSLAIDGLGDFTEQGSALLNFAIVGGACFPPLQGMVADHWNVDVSYLVPAVCIVVVTVYGLSADRRHHEFSIVNREL
jgi:FHS family L-fucose permease-like MFS transporter